MMSYRRREANKLKFFVFTSFILTIREQSLLMTRLGAEEKFFLTLKNVLPNKFDKRFFLLPNQAMTQEHLETQKGV